jgi:hypothetical protein
MSNPISRDDNLTFIKNHEEILSKLEEIKKFEHMFPAFLIEELKIIDDLIEVEPKPEEFIPFKELKEPATPTVFRLRLTEDGKLENIDLKKPKPKKEIKLNLKKLIPKKITRKKEPKDSDSKSKISMLKGGLKIISKLKKVIPSRGTKEKETTESEEQK